MVDDRWLNGIHDRGTRWSSWFYVVTHDLLVLYKRRESSGMIHNKYLEKSSHASIPYVKRTSKMTVAILMLL